MDIEKKIFERYTPDTKMLKNYGFQKEKDKYTLEKKFMNNQFLAKISVSKNGVISGKVYDNESGEEYLPLKLENIQGSFVSEVKENYTAILNDIKDKCFIQNYFISNQANRLAGRIFVEFCDEPVFMWEKFPGFGVFKNPDNNKWYAIIMTVARSKLGEKSTEQVEIINLKLDKSKIQDLLNERGFYLAWHMNKKSWITITLDETLSDEEIMDYIQESHSYTINKHYRSC